MRNTEITACTLFTTALCNLNCAYCYICKDKNGGLQQIDNDLAKDFQENKYIKQLLDYDENLANTLQQITLWGGEPFLHMERFIEQIDNWFKTFPNLCKIDSSTNFTIKNQSKIIELLLHKIAENYIIKDGKKFLFQLQLSIDGYYEMNEVSRGKGVTNLFLQNWKELLDIVYDYNKIDFQLHIKPTLAKSCFHFLDTEEKCYNWFQYLNDELYVPYLNSSAKFQFFLAPFNCACPTEWTKEDGIQFAKIVQNIMNISSQIKETLVGWANDNDYFFVSSHICRMVEEMHINSLEELTNILKAPCGPGHCGVFTGCIVPIPHDTFTMCHRGLFDNYVDYCNNLNLRDELNGLSTKYFKHHNVKDWLYTKEELHKMQDIMNQLFCPNTIAYTDFITIIREYAIAGLIDEKYKNPLNIEPTLGYFLHNSYCVQDAYIMNGSWVTRSFLEVPLFYNGVMDLVMQQVEKTIKSKGVQL